MSEKPDVSKSPADVQQYDMLIDPIKIERDLTDAYSNWSTYSLVNAHSEKTGLLCNTWSSDPSTVNKLNYNTLEGETIPQRPPTVLSSSENTPLLKCNSSVSMTNEELLSVTCADGEVRTCGSRRIPWMEIMTALLACFTPYSRGFVVGYTSPTIDRFIDSNLLSHGESSLFGGLVNFGGILSCLVLSFAMDRLGRRGTLMAAAVPQFVGWVCIWTAREHVALIVGRILNGFGSAVVFSSFHIYIAEMAHRSRRGTLCALCETFISLGTTSAYLIGQFVSNQTLAGIGAGLSLAMFVSMVPLKESPRWLIEKGRLAEGMAALLWLRKGGYIKSEGACPVEKEFQEISDKLQDSDNYPRSICSGGGLRELGAVRRPLIICLVMMLLQGFSGTVAVVAFMQTIFEKAHFSHPGAATVAAGLLRFLATLVAGLLVDKVGRKKLLIVGGLIQVLSLGAIAVSFYIQSSFHLTTHQPHYNGSQTAATTTALPSFTTLSDMSNLTQFLTYLCIAGVWTFLFAHSLGWGTVPSVVISELFPQRQRAVAGSVITLAGLTTGTLCAFLFKPLCHAITEAGAFSIFALTSLAGVVFIVVTLPETKNRTLEEISEIMTSSRRNYDVIDKAVVSQGRVTMVTTTDTIPVTPGLYQVKDINASNSSLGSFSEGEAQPFLKK